MIDIRPATPDDAEQLLQIYNPYILHSAITFETDLPSITDFSKRIARCLERFPWLVGTENNRVAGYVYASPHRDRAAYQWSCECSVYVADDYKGRGVGRHLYDALFALLKMQGMLNVYAGITLPNDASVRLHEKMGFSWLATYEEVGYKNGWQNVGWWRLRLAPAIPDPPPPVNFPALHQHLVKEILSGSVIKINTDIKD